MSEPTPTKQADKKPKKKDELYAGIGCLGFIVLVIVISGIYTAYENSQMKDKIHAFAEKSESLDSLRHYCSKYYEKHKDATSGKISSVDTIISNNCQEIWAPLIAEEREAIAVKKAQAKEAEAAAEAAKKETKEYKYNEMYGKSIDAFTLYASFQKNPLKMDEACKKSPRVQVEGNITDMGINSLGKYIDLATQIKGEGNIRIFLEDGEWNNNIISSGKIKVRDYITIGGLCYGQTETLGIKSKMIIGNARILKKAKEYL